MHTYTKHRGEQYTDFSCFGIYNYQLPGFRLFNRYYYNKYYQEFIMLGTLGTMQAANKRYDRIRQQKWSKDHSFGLKDGKTGQIQEHYLSLVKKHSFSYLKIQHFVVTNRLSKKLKHNYN